jgi:hypothetical protein
MSPRRVVKPDKFAQNARAWKGSADVTYRAAAHLFETRDLLLIFPAATLAHHALEMYLKAALICAGCTVLCPEDVKNLDPTTTLKKSDCVWGHDLVLLARELATRRSDFDLTARMTFLGPWQRSVVLAGEVPTACQPQMLAPTVETGFKVFNPFTELRYPHELTLSGLGEDDKLTLDELVRYLQPFVEKTK